MNLHMELDHRIFNRILYLCFPDWNAVVRNSNCCRGISWDTYTWWFIYSLVSAGEIS